MEAKPIDVDGDMVDVNLEDPAERPVSHGRAICWDPHLVRYGFVMHKTLQRNAYGFSWACVHWLSQGTIDCLCAALQQHARIGGERPSNCFTVLYMRQKT